MVQQMDPAKVEQFAGHVLETLNGAATTLLMSVGHKTGLFDVMSTLPPSTSQQIAQAAGLQERYVREWLGGMTTARFVTYDPATRTYAIPPEHAAVLTRAAGTNNLAVYATTVPIMGNVEEKVVESFRVGGGVPYSAYKDFQKLQAELSGIVHDASLIPVILPLVPGLPQRLEKGIDVADIGCGSGHAINLMARAYPNSRFLGYDFSEEGIAKARAEAREWGLTNARFEVRDVAELGEKGRFDLVTSFDAIHDQAHPAVVLKSIAEALRPDGVYLMVDEGASSNLEENLDHPIGTLLYTFSVFHCMTVSLAQGGDALGTVWGEQLAKRMLAEAGFSQVEVKKVEGDIENNYYIARKRY